LGGKLWHRKIWETVFQTAFGKIKFDESFSGACPKLYNYFTNDTSNAHEVPLVKLRYAKTA